MKRKILILLAILVVIIAAIAIYFTQKPKEPETIKIGAILPLTGELSIFGNWLKEGIIVASEDYKNIQFIFEDNKNQTSVALSAFNKLIAVDNVKAVISARTPVAYALAPLALKSKVPILFTFADLPESIEGGVINFHFPLEDEIKFIAKSQEYLGDRAAVIVVNDEFGNLALSLFKKYFEKDIVYIENFDPKQVDFRSIVEKIPRSTSFIFLVGYGQNLVALIKTLAEKNINIPIVSVNSFINFYDLVKSYLKTPAYITMTLYNVNRGNEVLLSQIRSKFLRKFNKEPNVVNLEAFEATKFLIEILQKNKFDTKKVFEAINTPQTISSIFGNLKLDNKGQVHFPLVLAKIYKNKFEIIKIWEP
jgi:branched-chain amino acid transport system substrate-binding protein